MIRPILFLIFVLSSISILAQLNIQQKQLIGKDSTHLKAVEGHYLTPAAGRAYYKMKLAAYKDSINIKLVSAYRSFDHQKQIWNRKFDYYLEQGFTYDEIFKKITDYSTMPGTSRHHWGTEIDIIAINGDMPMRNVLNEKHFKKGGAFAKLYNWLKENAHKYGFYEAYTNNPQRSGFHYEPWHYSFRPQAVKNLKIYTNSDLYQHVLQLPIRGLNEISEALKNDYLTDQILSIHPDLQLKNK
jgi:LAS superfamily LD-carboxypeptidase LdcB